MDWGLFHSVRSFVSKLPFFVGHPAHSQYVRLGQEVETSHLGALVKASMDHT